MESTRMMEQKMGFKIERNAKGHITAISWRLMLPGCLVSLMAMDYQHITALLFLAVA